ncbi:MAG: AMP-binding protein [Pseudomonadota bacterium]
MTALGEMSGVLAERFVGTTALSIGDAQIPFVAVHQGTAQLASAFQENGLRPGDRIAILLLTTPDFVMAYLAAHRAGLVVMPLNPLLGPSELVHILQTMQPKGISISEGMVIANRDASEREMMYTQADTILCGLPFSHVFGQVVIMLAGLMAGATLRLAPRPSPDLLFADLKATSPSVFVGVPTTIAAVAAMGRQDPEAATQAASNLRLVATGGSNMPLAIGADFKAVFGHDVYQGYGMTEVCGCIAVADFDRPAGEDVGAVWPLFDWKIEGSDSETATRGELLIRGPNVFRGYYKDGVLAPRAVDEWFATGDVVELVDGRYITIIDRKKEMIIRGGYNVYPSEVEAALVSHPDVELAAVVGFPDEELGEEIGAFVTAKDSASIDTGALKQWVRDRIALYKYPRQIIVIETMPTNPTGKILKKALPVDVLSDRHKGSGQPALTS